MDSLAMNAKTKIIATISKLRCDKPFLRGLLEEGTDVFRLNFSHMTADEAAGIIRHIKELRQELNIPLAMIADTKGPELRLTGYSEPVHLKTGEKILISGSEENPENPENLTAFKLTLEYVSGLIEENQKVLLMDGYIEGHITDIIPAGAVVTIDNSAELRPRAHITFPGVNYPLPFLSDKDRIDICYAIENNLEYLALSFVKEAGEVEMIRRIVQEINPDSPIGIIAKIETPQAIAKLEEIIEASDGIMVARGDLGVELPLEKVPPMQKRI
ncbi:MAG: pyruvate kinase, partial [Candidatus Cloacimonetes bacterium]|nr:pyruvate kinase [Candidatus Cloacimonadota bacterium]